MDEIMARAPKKKLLDGSGPKPVIMEIEEKLQRWIHERRSHMLHVSRKRFVQKQRRF